MQRGTLTGPLAEYTWEIITGGTNQAFSHHYHTTSHHRKSNPYLKSSLLVALEYVDMVELQSEHWDNYDKTESVCCSSHSTRSSRRTPVSNILDCYASLVSVLCSAHPEKFGQFMTYQKTIISAHHRYAGDGLTAPIAARQRHEIFELGANGWVLLE